MGICLQIRRIVSTGIAQADVHRGVGALIEGR